MIDSFEKFNDEEQFKYFIQTTPNRSHHFILVTDETNYDFLTSSIIDFGQIIKIYVSDVNSSIKDNRWLDEYSKVKYGGLFHQMDVLIIQVTLGRKHSYHVKGSSLTINGIFLRFQMLIDLLLGLKHNGHNRN